jgi:ABC-2 type transport system permease protein
MLEINPILVKELRSRMRGARAFVLLTFYLIILSGVSVLLYAAMSGSMASGDLNAGRLIGKTLFLVVAAVALVEVCLITPSLTSGSIAGERERQTYDLLIASLLSPWQIIWGKLASALAFAFLLILAVVPVMSLAFLFGGVSLAEVLIALIGLATTAVTYATIGLFWSAVMRGSLGATSFSIGSVVLILLGIPFIVVIVLVIFSTGGSDMFESPLIIYLSRILLASHPFIALGMTENLLSTGSSPFIEEVVVSPSTGGTIPVPSPWILYVAISAIFSAILLFFAVRAIQPMQPPVAKTLPKRSPSSTPPAPPTPSNPDSPPVSSATD